MGSGDCSVGEIITFKLNKELGNEIKLDHQTIRNIECCLVQIFRLGLSPIYNLLTIQEVIYKPLNKKPLAYFKITTQQFVKFTAWHYSVTD